MRVGSIVFSLLLLLCVGGWVTGRYGPGWVLVSAAPVSVQTSPTIGPQTTSPTEHVDPIYAEYERKARELYVKALTDYYSAHPARLTRDLSQLTSSEYYGMVPPELLDSFHLDRTKIEAQIKENDQRMMNEMEEAEAEQAHQQDNMGTMAVDEDEEADAEPASDLETSQFRGRFGRFGGFGRFGRFGGFGRFGRFGGFGRFGRFGRFGFGRFGFGFPFGGFGWGGYGFPYGGFGWGGYGFPGFGFGWRRFGWW